MRVRTWLLAVLLAAGATAAVAGSRQAASGMAAGAVPERPNIILITADTFRPDRLGYYGRSGDTSPTLDTFSREGTFFTQAFTTSGWTSPGLLAILTGLDALACSVDVRGKSLDAGTETLPKALRRAGYTAPDIFFLTDIPNFHHLGFTVYAHREELLYQGDEILFHWIRHEARSHQPFFLYYHYRELHLPYDPGEPFESMFLPRAFSSSWRPVRVLRRFLAAEKMRIVKTQIHLTRGVMDFGDRDAGWVRALYDAQIRKMDTQLFAPLRDLLQLPELRNNTLVIISADHGEELLDHGLIGHVSTFKEGCLYEEIIHIPLIMWFPGVIPAGRVIDTPVQSTDIMPTVLDLAGLEPVTSIQGRSLRPLLLGSTDQQGWEARPLFFATSGAGYTANAQQYAHRYRAVRTDAWKLHHAVSEKRTELYDLRRDPGEQQNLADQRPLVADSLQALLDEWVLQRQVQRYAAVDTATAIPPVAPVAESPVSGVVAEDNSGATNVRILLPAPGDTLGYTGAEHRVRLQWTSPDPGPYVIQYDVGSGAYHLNGEFVVNTMASSYGPFTTTVWNSAALYNPFHFRVYPQGHAAAVSEWRTFYLAAGGEARPGVVRAWWQRLRGALLATILHTGRLLAGLGRGLLDLYLLLATIPAADLSAYALLLVIAAAIIWPYAQRWGLPRCRAWAGAVLYIAFVYATIPVMPTVWRTLNTYTAGSIRYLGIVAVVILGILVLLRLWARAGLSRWRPYLALLLLIPVYAYLLHRFATFPAERLHLVEYGFMGWMLFRALRVDLSPGMAYAVSFGATVLIGVGDECIQWMLPQRVFELKDIQLNAVSGALGLLLLHFVEEPQPGTRCK